MKINNFFAELKRRNVYKVAVAYAVVGWLLVQVATQVFPFFEIPNWAVRLVVLAIIIGFPVALILAWAFELTPEGIKRTEEDEPARPRGRAWIYVAIVAAALSIALFFLGRCTAPSKSSAATKLSSKSIAVLPFENLSSEKENAYFASGIQDEILTRLTRIGALKVISRTSTAHYASSPHNLPEIAKELGVANILEGSVQKAGEAVHINVQLVRAATDEHLWAESYDRDLKNIFGVEREIAETIAGQLKAQLLPEEAKELARVPTTNPEAYDLFLRAKYINQQYWNAEVDSNKPAVEFLRKAIALDPDFALAYLELAHAQSRIYSGGEEDSPKLLSEAEANAQKALTLQPNLAEAHLALAVISDLQGENEKARSEFDYLEKNAPNDPNAILAIARNKFSKGDWQASLAGRLRALELDPKNSTWWRWLAGFYGSIRHYDDADKSYVKAIELSPEDWIARRNRANTWLDQGDIARTRQELESWPDAKLGKVALWLKYSLLESTENYSRHFDAALAAGQKIPDMGDRIPTSSFPIGNIQKYIDLGFVYLYQKDSESAGKAFLTARNALEPQRAAHANDPHFYQAAAGIAAGLGERDTALGAANKAIALMPLERDVYDGANYLITLAKVHGHFGDANNAMPILEKLFAMPTTGHIATPAILRLDPIWDPIRNDPRFQKLCEEKTP